MRNEEECRQVALTKALPHGLEEEVTCTFDRYLAEGDDAEQALFWALNDWHL